MTARLDIDGRRVEAAPGANLLEVCLSRGVDVPYFCWHPALGALGACRQCAVRVHEGPEDAEGAVVMACMTPAADGQRVVVADPQAAELRRHLIEALMQHHPLDCPICAEGGACHLQDMTVMVGHRDRRAAVRKRTFRSQDLGPLVSHEMNRCITCYRCTRFYADYAGGRDLQAFGSKDRVYFGREEDGPLESPFAGNLIEVCPTGVFGDKPLLRRFAREWDLESTPSVCPGCSVGCHIGLGARDGVVRRTRNRYAAEVNGHFLCDRGRFLHLASAGVAPEVGGERVDVAEAAGAARAAVAEGAVGLASPRASLEAGFALRALVGPERFFSTTSDAEAARVRRGLALLDSGPARPATLPEMEAADAVLVLGEDVGGTAPRIALALRQAAGSAARARARALGVPLWHDAAVRAAGTRRRTPFVLVTPRAGPLDAVATRAVRAGPEGAADFGAAVASALAGGAAAAGPAACAEALRAAERPLVVTGHGLEAPQVIEAAAQVAQALGARARWAVVPPEANSHGLAMLGPAGGVEAATRALEAGPARTLVVLEGAPELRADPRAVARLYAAAGTVVRLDDMGGGRADVRLPAAGFAASAGTSVSFEGRAQRFWAALPEGVPAWRRLAAWSGQPWADVDAVATAMAEAEPRLAPLETLAAEAPWPEGRVARAPRPSSGRTARIAHAPGWRPPEDPDAPLAFSMEGASGARVPGPLVSLPTAPGWTSSEALHRFTEEVHGPLRGGEGGVRLFGQDGWRDAAPEAGVGAEEEDGLRVVRLCDPLSGEERAGMSPPLRERADPAGAVLHPRDAERLGLLGVERVEVRVAEGPVLAASVPLAVDRGFAPGCLGLGAGAVAPRGLRGPVRVAPAGGRAT